MAIDHMRLASRSSSKLDEMSPASPNLYGMGKDAYVSVFEDSSHPPSTYLGIIRRNREKLRLFFRGKPWKHAIFAIIFLVSSGWAMSLSVTLVHFRMPDPRKYPPLPDIIHDYVPAYNAGFVGEVIYHINTVMSLVTGLIYCRELCVPLVIRFFMAWGWSWYMRCVVLFATQLPPTTDFHCRFDYPNYPDDFPHPIQSIFWNTALGVFTGGNGQEHCGDLLPSGHTSLLIVNWMFILSYIRPHNKWIAIISSLLVISKLFLMVIERKHYTTDVVVALYISVTIWKLTPEHLPEVFIQMASIFRSMCNCMCGFRQAIFRMASLS